MIKILLIFSLFVTLYSSDLKLNKEEKKFIDSHIIRCITTMSWEPFNTIIDGKLTGIAISYWDNIKKQLNIKSVCEITNRWGDVLAAIKNRKADISLATSDTKEREKYAIFSKSYVKFPIVIATKNNIGFISDISLLKGKKIAVGKDYTAENLLKKYYPSFNIVETKNIDQALKLLCQNKVYAVIDILPVIAYKINKYDYSSLKISGKTPWNFAVKFMIRKDYAILASAINKAIDNITENEKIAIYSRWIKVNTPQHYTIKDILPFFIVILVTILLILFYVLHLKKEIKTRKELEVQLEKLATLDRLTSIFNRYKMDLTLDEQIEIAKRYKRDLSLIFFDIDHFKKINDKYGHKTGDMVLKELSKLIQVTIRKSDVFGRWGGEEFLIILPETTKKEAVKLAEKLRHKIQEYNFPAIGKLTCSFGVTSYKDGDTIETMLSRVDKKLYLAKESGRNQVRYK